MLFVSLPFVSPTSHAVSGAQLPAPLSPALYFQTNLLHLFLFYTLHFRETSLNIWKHTSLLFFKAFSEIQLNKMPLQPLWAKCVIRSIYTPPNFKYLK